MKRLAAIKVLLLTNEAKIRNTKVILKKAVLKNAKKFFFDQVKF